jgi:hypothetical protein
MDDPTLHRRVVRAFEHFGLDVPLEAIVARPQPRPGPRIRWRLVTAVAAPLLVVLAIGILLGRQIATPASVFGSWQQAPSLDDPKLAAAARSACLHEGDEAANLLIQDQRGLAAALLFRSGNDMVMCVAYFSTTGEVGAATSSGTHLVPETTAFGIDSVGRAPGYSATSPGLTWLFGHQPASAVRVVLLLEDATQVKASTSDGWFLAWWPSDQTVASMTAVDARGASETISDPETAIGAAPSPTDVVPSAELPNPGGTCSASQFVAGTPTYSYGFGTLNTTVVFVTVLLKNAGASCVLALPRTVAVANAIGPFHLVPMSNASPVTSWASGPGESLPLVIGASWWTGARDSNGDPIGSQPSCADPVADVTRLAFPFATGTSVIDLPAVWREVCSSPPSLSVTFETK